MKPKYPTGRNRRRTLWLPALVLALSAQGCVTINDNTDDCFPLARLRFEYTYNLDGTDRFREQVESIDLYAYRKEDGSLAAAKRITQADMIRENYSVSLKWLRQGDYDLVAFGNKAESDYDCLNHQQMTDLRLRMICSDGLGTMIKNPVHLFHGATELRKNDTGEITVGMVKNTNDMNITVRHKTTRAGAEGLPDLTITIEARNGTLKHDNSIDGGDARTMTHISNCAFGQYATSLQTMLRVGRLSSADGSTITIRETESGRVLSSESLTGKILELLAGDMRYAGMDSDVYLDKQDTYDLVYDAEMKYGVLVTTLITINGWSLQENPIGGV